MLIPKQFFAHRLASWSSLLALCCLAGTPACGGDASKAKDPRDGGPPPSEHHDATVPAMDGSQKPDAEMSVSGPDASNKADADVDADAPVPDGSVADAGVDAGRVKPIDCSAVPDEPLEPEELDGPRGYHGLAFVPSGSHLIGSDGDALIRAASTGPGQVYLPGVGMVQGMDMFANGDLLVAADGESGGELLRITPAGGITRLTQGLGQAYGVRVGPNGMAYVANNEKIFRVDPETRKRTVLVGAPPDSPSDAGSGWHTWSPRVMDYSPDHRTLYIGSLSGGTVYALDMDEDFNPVGDARVFADGMGNSFQDGLSVDACGNLYVADFSGSALFRVTPEGKVKLYKQWTSQSYGHGIVFGSGQAGWDANALYLPQPYDNNTVVKLVIGVPARPR